MTGPSISEQREAVERARRFACGVNELTALRAATETLAVVEWMQRLNPAAWAREVTLYKRAQAELAAMGKQEGRGDG